MAAKSEQFRMNNAEKFMLFIAETKHFPIKLDVILMRQEVHSGLFCGKQNFVAFWSFFAWWRIMNNKWNYYEIVAKSYDLPNRWNNFYNFYWQSEII